MIFFTVKPNLKLKKKIFFSFLGGRGGVGRGC